MMNKSDMRKEFKNIEKQAQESEDSENVVIPMAFARELIRRTIYNPQKTTSKNSITYSNYTKENIQKWLQTPSTNEKNLRNASIYLYLSSMQYQRLINYYANLFLWSYVVSPLGFDKSKLATEKKKDNFKKQYLKVTHDLELMNIPETMRNIASVVLREGVYYGVKVSDSNSAFVQRIDANLCTITSMSDGVFLFAVDMSQITEDKLIYYPAIFAELYQKYKATGTKYQEIPPELSFCIKGDETIIDYSVPMFGAVMPALYTIANTEALQETKDELNNYKMISGQVPVDSDGQPKIPWDVYLKYYNHISNALGDRVGLAISPFDLKAIDFEQSGTVAEIDSVTRAINNYWTSAGTSGLLHGVANSTAGVTKLAIKNDENYIIGIMHQAERLINYHLKINYSSNVKFKINFLPITIYNREDFVKMYKESVAFGLGKSHYMVSLGIPQGDLEGLSYLENDVLEIDKQLKPLINSHNASSEELSGGRPEEDEENLSDEGESTRDNDSNENL